MHSTATQKQKAKAKSKGLQEQLHWLQRRWEAPKTEDPHRGNHMRHQSPEIEVHEQSTWRKDSKRKGDGQSASFHQKRTRRECHPVVRGTISPNLLHICGDPTFANFRRTCRDSCPWRKLEVGFGKSWSLVGQSAGRIRVGSKWMEG